MAVSDLICNICPKSQGSEVMVQKQLLILCLLTVTTIVYIVGAEDGRGVPCFGIELEVYENRELF